MQDPDLPPHRVKSYLEAYRKRFPRAELRRLPTGRYNCHGLTFASRRTQILDPEVVEIILKDDGYRPIGLRDAMQGDLALYYDGRGIAHTGVIVDVEQDERILGGGTVKVMSKWGSGGEYIHYGRECEYVGQGREIAYWTDRHGSAHELL